MPADTWNYIKLERINEDYGRRKQKIITEKPWVVHTLQIEDESSWDGSAFKDL